MESQAPKKNSNVIYFLIVVILALIGTDIYLFLKKKQTENTVTVQSDQKTRLQSELDSLELQIEQVNAGKTKVSAELQAKNDSLKVKIRDLRIQLDKGKLTIAELNKAQEDVKQLRYFVTKYTADIDELKKKNEDLTTERDTLKSTLTTVSTDLSKTKEKATTLQKQNEDLSTKVKVASALKVGSINIKSFKVKDNGKESDNDRAAVVKKLKIEFTIASNPIAEKKLHDVFVRVIDPTGNLITAPESSTFQVEGQDLQYTYKAPIDFKDDGSGFTVDWINPNKFQKGIYTVLLYADGYAMGKATVTLK
jgi:phage shock protein A